MPSYILNGLSYVGDLPSKYPARSITQAAFLRRFTQAERIQIRQAAGMSAQLDDYMRLLDAAAFVDLDDEVTRDGIQAIEAAGLLAEGRALEVLDADVSDNEKPI